MRQNRRIAEVTELEESVVDCVVHTIICSMRVFGIPPVDQMAGGMGVVKNKHIEDWGTARENLEKAFRFTRRNITIALVFGIAVPFLTYQGVTGEFVSVLSFTFRGMVCLAKAFRLRW